MKATDIQKSININQIFELLTELGGQPKLINDNEIISKGICHGGSSHKLYYYDNSKRFTCYTNCGSGFSIFDLVQKSQGIDFISSLNFIRDRFNIVNNYNPSVINQMPDFNCFKKFSGETQRTIYEEYDHKVLNQFRKLYHPNWLNDGISIEAMNKYNIRFNILNNQIIIPHYDDINRLIGIRVRNLSLETLDNQGKYMPLYYCSQQYPHSLGGNLYGLNIVENNIKRFGKVIIFESEKACMQLETMYPNNNIAIGLCGSTITDEQADIINDLGVDEVIIALDKEFKDINTKDEIEYAKKIRANFLSKLLVFHKVSIIWDKDNILDEQDSPSDKGKEIFRKLFDDRLVISE